MKRYTVTDSLSGERFTVEVEDGATSEEVTAAAQAEAAKRRQVASEPEEIGPLAPAPFPWRDKQNDPNDDEIRCTHCAITAPKVKRKDLGKHLAAHPEVTGAQESKKFQLFPPQGEENDE